MKPAAVLFAMLFALPFALAGRADADVIHLDTGEVLQAQVVAEADGQITIEHAILGTITLPADRIASIEAPADGEGDGEAQPQPAPEPAAQPEPAPQPEPQPSGLMAVLKDWNTSVEIGASATRGNTETADLRIGVSAKRETDKRRLQLGASYYGASDDGETTNNEFNANATHDWLIPETPWFYFAKGTYDFDQFEDWRHRVAAFGGVGYEWVVSDNLTLTPRAGIGGAREFGGDDDEIRPEALLGADLAWTPREGHAVEASSYLYPDLDEFGESRITSTLAWSMDLPSFEGMAFKWGLEHEYESRTEGDQEHNDLKVFATMVFDF